MLDKAYNDILNFLTPKRMASVGNIAAALECSPEDIISKVQEMEKLDLIRLATSSCSSNCSSCSSCGTQAEEKPPVTDRTIAISLQKLNDDLD